MFLLCFPRKYVTVHLGCKICCLDKQVLSVFSAPWSMELFFLEKASRYCAKEAKRKANPFLHSAKNSYESVVFTLLKCTFSASLEILCRVLVPHLWNHIFMWLQSKCNQIRARYSCHVNYNSWLMSRHSYCFMCTKPIQHSYCTLNKFIQSPEDTFVNSVRF